MTIQAMQNLADRFLSGNDIQVERAVISRQEFLDIQQRINELENKLWSIGSGEHYIYPKGEIASAKPFEFHESFYVESKLTPLAGPDDFDLEICLNKTTINYTDRD